MPAPDAHATPSDSHRNRDCDGHTNSDCDGESDRYCDGQSNRDSDFNTHTHGNTIVHSTPGPEYLHATAS